MSDVVNPQILYKESYADCDVTDVEVCGDFVFIAFNNETEREQGFLNVYRVYNKDTGALELVNSVVGKLYLIHNCIHLIDNNVFFYEQGPSVSNFLV